MSQAIVLVEINADRIGGHWPGRLIRLASAAAAQGTPVTAVALLGCAPSTRQTLQRHGATIIDQPHRWDLASWALLLTGKALGYASDFAGRARPIRSWKWQFTLLSWCLIEAASLRAAAYRRRGQAVYIIMTASGALHGLTTRLAGVAHLRIVHELLAHEGRVLSWLSTAGRSYEGKTIAVCLAASVASEHRSRFPGVPAVIHKLGLYDCSDYLSEQERSTARSNFHVMAGEVVISLVGGWWPYKDTATIAAACHLVTNKLRVIVAGTPLNEQTLGVLANAPNVRLETLHGEVETSEHRQVYAAADLTIVARHAGIAKSSGLVTDAARMGVPLLVSDHDPALTAALSDRPWVRLFRAGNARSLADAITNAAMNPPVRPNQSEAARLGLVTSASALEALLQPRSETSTRTIHKITVSA